MLLAEFYEPCAIFVGGFVCGIISNCFPVHFFSADLCIEIAQEKFDVILGDFG